MNRRSDHEATEGRPQDGFMRGGPQGGTLARRSLVLLIGGGVLALAVLSQLGENGVLAWVRLRHQEREIAGEVARLEMQNQAKNEIIEALKNDPGELERFARVHFSMQRKDEEVVRMVSDPVQKD